MKVRLKREELERSLQLPFLKSAVSRYRAVTKFWGYYLAEVPKFAISGRAVNGTCKLI